MATFPANPLPALPTITASSLECLGLPFVSYLNANPWASPISTSWPSANLAIFLPFRVFSTTKFVEMAVYHGATADGNVDVGIYDPTGVRLVSMGSTAMSGTATVVSYNIADTTLPPGLYFMALACSSATAAIVCHLTLDVIVMKSLGLYTCASSFPLPATVTYASNTLFTNVPIFSLNTINL